MDIMKFWYRVKSLIKAHKLTQYQFAKHIGISPSTFNGWIYHKRIPDLETALHIGAALGVNVEYLAFGKDGRAVKIRAQQVEERKIAAERIKKLSAKMQEAIKQI